MKDRRLYPGATLEDLFDGCGGGEIVRNQGLLSSLAGLDVLYKRKRLSGSETHGMEHLHRAKAIY